MAPFSTVIMPRWICNSINTRLPQEQLTGSQFAGHIKPFAIHHGCFPKFSGRHPFYFRLDSSDHLRPCVHALSELSAHYGASVVLCTATQPALTPIFREFQPELSPRELCPDELAVSPVFRRTTITCAGKLSWEGPTKRLSGQHQALCMVPPHTGWVD